MGDQKLSDITGKLIKAGEFLHKLTGGKLECIQSFCDCQEIVHWIRITTKGINSSSCIQFCLSCFVSRCD